MKKSVITCVLISTISVAASAQNKTSTTPQPAPPSAALAAVPASTEPVRSDKAKAGADEGLLVRKNAEKRATNVTEQLNLTHDQYDQVYKAEYIYEMAYKKSIDRYKADPVALNKLKSEKYDQLVAVLTPAQLEKYKILDAK